jgi:hypothetical protein
MYSSPTLRAVVVMAPGLEPAPGSVRPKQPSFSPLARREPGVLLLVGAEGVDGVHHQAGLHADKAAEAGVAAFQLLHHQAVLDVGHAGAAVALEVGAEEAQLAHDGDQFARKALGAEALLDDGDEVVFDKVARGFADEQFVLAEAGVEVEKSKPWNLKPMIAFHLH